MQEENSLSGNVPEHGEDEEDNQVYNKDAGDDVHQPCVEG